MSRRWLRFRRAFRAAAGVASPDEGVARITASEIVSSEVLPPILARFREKYPRVAIELGGDQPQRGPAAPRRRYRGAHDAPDPGARWWRGGSASRASGSMPTSDYLQRLGTPKTLQDLASHHLIGYDRDDRRFARSARFPRLGREAFAFRCDNDPAQLAALRAGVGIGGCQENIARRTPELTRLFAEDVSLAAGDLARHARGRALDAALENAVRPPRCGLDRLRRGQGLGASRKDFVGRAQNSRKL